MTVAWSVEGRRPMDVTIRTAHRPFEGTAEITADWSDSWAHPGSGLLPLAGVVRRLPEALEPDPARSSSASSALRPRERGVPFRRTTRRKAVCRLHLLELPCYVTPPADFVVANESRAPLVLEWVLHRCAPPARPWKVICLRKVPNGPRFRDGPGLAAHRLTRR